MSRWKHWIFYAVMLFWIVPAVIYYIGINSERTKRVELEQSLLECAESMDKIGEALGVEPRLVDAWKEEYRPTDSGFNIFKGLGDNKIQFSPIDSSGMTLYEICRVSGHVLGKQYLLTTTCQRCGRPYNPPDSSEVKDE